MTATTTGGWFVDNWVHRPDRSRNGHRTTLGNESTGSAGVFLHPPIHRVGGVLERADPEVLATANLVRSVVDDHAPVAKVAARVLEIRCRNGGGLREDVIDLIVRAHPAHKGSGVRHPAHKEGIFSDLRHTVTLKIERIGDVFRLDVVQLDFETITRRAGIVDGVKVAQCTKKGSRRCSTSIFFMIVLSEFSSQHADPVHAVAGLGRDPVAAGQTSLHDGCQQQT